MGSLHTTLKSKGAELLEKFEPINLRGVMIRWMRPPKLHRVFDLKKGRAQLMKV
nr:hypothetical protein [uncultured Alloprevotella sp.]